MKRFDLTVIGGGIVGLAVARKLALECPKLSLCVLDKERELALHQSWRNSGVVHCGVYYKKGTLKSKLCKRGAQLTRDYCKAKNLPYLQCGKLIVANHSSELERLHKLFDNGQENEVEGLELWTGEQVRALQPDCTNALEAIWSPNTAVVDWRQVALAYAEDFKALGGTIINSFTAYKFEKSHDDQYLVIEDAKDERRLIESRAVVNCAGLYSDYFARQTGNNEHPKVVPFRGNYFFLSDTLAPTIKTNIYPVPNPDLPFLGIHLTPRVDGRVLVGPTAGLSLSYERYSEIDDINLLESYHIFVRSGLRKLLRKPDFLMAAWKERKLGKSRKLFANEVRKFLPNLQSTDLVFTEFSGIRAQTVNFDGKLVDDFLFETGVWSDFRKVLHIRNAPSPAATSSQAIADQVFNIVQDRLL